jgi:hypothetical protein
MASSLSRSCGWMVAYFSPTQNRIVSGLAVICPEHDLLVGCRRVADSNLPVVPGNDVARWSGSATRLRTQLILCQCVRVDKETIFIRSSDNQGHEAGKNLRIPHRATLVQRAWQKPD